MLREFEVLSANYARYFLAWWYSTLLEFLPRSLGRDSLRFNDAVIISLQPNRTMVVLHRRGGVETFVAEIELCNPHIALLTTSFETVAHIPRLLVRVPVSNILERSVTLPLAAEKHARNALALQLERLIPFPAKTVYWNFTTELRDTKNGHLTLRMIILQKAVLQPILELLHSVGRTYQSLAVVVAESNDTIEIVGEPHKSIDKSTAERLLNLSTAASICIATFLPFIRQQVAIISYQSKLVNLESHLKEAQDIRRQREVILAAHLVIMREAQKVGDVLETLSLISQLFPGDSYLTEFEMHERKLILTGKSASASHLIQILAHDAHVINPMFVAPVVKDSTDKSDVFSISLQMRNSDV